MLPVPCLHSSHQRQQIAASSPRKQAGAEEKGREKEKKQHHSAHQTPGSAFFKPAPPLLPVPRLGCCAAPPPPPHIAHPPLSTQGHPSRLCMTARYIPCHKCFPKASTSVTLSADKKKPPHKPLMKCASYFFWMCQQFLAGWSDTTSWRCLLCLCHRVHARVCVCVGGVVFVVAYVDLNIFTFFALLFLLFLHGAEGKRPCHSSTT